MKHKILEVITKNPTLSTREISKLVGTSKSTVQYYLNLLNIHRDRKEMQKLNNTCREKRLIITDIAEQIILGSILGDGYLSPNRHPINTKLTLNSELRITHGIKQKDYIEYKKKLLENEGVKCYLKFNDKKNVKEHFIKGIKVKENGSYYLKTQRNVAFNFYRDLFYRPNKKIGRYFYKINALALAIWYMDDGFKHGNGFTLCTNSFSINDVNLLRIILKHNFNIETSIHNSNLGKPLIYIRTKSKDTFIKLISPYICKSMNYKIGI